MHFSRCTPEQLRGVNVFLKIWFKELHFGLKTYKLFQRVQNDLQKRQFLPPKSTGILNSRENILKAEI